jgi:acyl-homoserine-lactone acylase
MKKVWATAALCCLVFSVFSQNLATKKGLREFRASAAADSSQSVQPSAIDPSQIDIVRDAFGVPHIFAKTDREVAYGLAWAHAEDDFNTIQKAILASKSMLGQHLGKEGAQVDYAVQFLRLQELVRKRYKTDISPAFKSVLQGYCDGLNAYAEAFPREVLVKKSFPSTPQDLLVYSLLQLALGVGLEDAFKQMMDEPATLVQWEPSGSNAFAFNSKKTADGNVYLTINTHHPLEGQVAWYETHLSSEEGWNIVGALFPGSPVVFTGFNENLGWTHTVNHPDRLDLYKLEMNPANHLQYKVDGAWQTLEEQTVKLKVKLSALNVIVRKKAYWSIYGPTMMTEKGVFSIRTGAIQDIRALEQWYHMNKSRNFSEFKTALRMEALPSYNLVYGDRYDTIFYLSNGKIPVRHAGFNWKETLPGNTSLTLWRKFHPLDELPQVLDPASGYVYNVNHSPFQATAPEDNIRRDDYDVNMGYETHDNNRSYRFQELLTQQAKITYEDFKRIKYDLQLPAKLAYPVNMDTLFLLDERSLPEIADLIRMLKNWDRKATIESTGATVFAVVFYQVAARYLLDKSFKSMNREDCIDAIYFAKDYLRRNFGSLEVPLGEYQRLERGDKSLPLAGIPDVLATMYSTPKGNGQMRGTIGDCYIAFATFTPAGPEIESINCYGASNRITSPHYNDQADLYQKQQTKKMSLDRDKVYEEAKKIYHPEVLSKVRIPERLLRARK